MIRLPLRMVTLVGGLLAANVAASVARADVTVGRAWPADQQVPISQIDHAHWDALLKKYVDARGDANYAAWKASAADTAQLDRYLATLSRADARKDATQSERLAYWINAYNAVTVKGILREYPTTSIRNHTAKLFGYNIWQDLLLSTPTGKHSLEHIEHEILRPTGEWRIHFAIVCASQGCPKLRREAYQPQRLERQLADNTRAFFADPGKFRADARTNRLFLSPILDWFAEDFGNTQPRRLAAIAPYLPTEAARKIARGGNAEVTYLDYDWSLNDQKSR